jgi:hypothetical protein
MRKWLAGHLLCLTAPPSGAARNLVALTTAATGSEKPGEIPQASCMPVSCRRAARCHGLSKTVFLLGVDTGVPGPSPATAMLSSAPSQLLRRVLPGEGGASEWASPERWMAAGTGAACGPAAARPAPRSRPGSTPPSRIPGTPSAHTVIVPGPKPCRFSCQHVRSRNHVLLTDPCKWAGEYGAGLDLLQKWPRASSTAHLLRVCLASSCARH